MAVLLCACSTLLVKMWYRNIHLWPVKSKLIRNKNYSTSYPTALKTPVGGWITVTVTFYYCFFCFVFVHFYNWLLSSFVLLQEQRSSGGNVRLDSRTLPWHKPRTQLELCPCLSFVLFLFLFFYCLVSTCLTLCSPSSCWEHLMK